MLAFVAIWHLTFWVVAPWLAYRMLPLDTLELLGWGQEWQWGYYKHPPLGAWLGELTWQVSGGRPEALYLLAQVCLVATLVYVWKTARMVLDPARAALATALLEGSYFHTFLTPNFNMNSLQLPLWAGLAYHFLRAWRGEQFHWLMAGLFAALCLLAKYSGLLLLASCALVVVSTAGGREALRRPGIYLGAALALLLLLPHLAWLSAHAELPFAYLRGFDQSGSESWSMHLTEPLRFAFAAMLGVLFSALIFLTVRDPRAAPPTLRIEARIVIALCLLPLLLTMLYGAVSGSRLKSTWAFPFFNLIGIVAFCLIPTQVNRRRLLRYSAALVAVAIASATIHLVYKLHSDRSKTGFDGEALAIAVEQGWNRSQRTPLRIVIGDHVLTAIVSSYAPSRPSMLINADFGISLWLNPEDVQRHGAAVVCVADEPCFEALQQRAEPVQRIVVDGRPFQIFHVAPGVTDPAPSAHTDPLSAPTLTGATRIAYP